jgi:hypothetical protein
VGRSRSRFRESILPANIACSQANKSGGILIQASLADTPALSRTQQSSMCCCSEALHSVSCKDWVKATATQLCSIHHVEAIITTQPAALPNTLRCPP